MTVAKTIRQEIKTIPEGKPFTTSRFLKLGTRANIDKTLSRMVQEGFIQRIIRGIFIRPLQSQYIGNVMPEAKDIVKAIAKEYGETIQVHGAEAARRFKLSTQMPVQPTYYTSGTTRELKIGNLMIKLIHTNNHRKLQHAGKKAGLALSALWYLGKDNINTKAIEHIRNSLGNESFEALCHSTDMPGWMEHAITQYHKVN